MPIAQIKSIFKDYRALHGCCTAICDNQIYLLQSERYGRNMAINENDSRVRRTKRLIRKGLMELAREKDISKISVKELADRIDINRGTFYLHYSDIEDLVECIQKEIYDEFSMLLSDVTIERIKSEPVEILYDICCFLNQNSDVCAVLLNSEKTSEFAVKTGDLLSKKCYELFREVYPHLTEEKYDLICEYYKYGAIGITRSWLNNHPDKTPRQIAELWLSMAKGGIIGIMEADSKAASNK